MELRSPFFYYDQYGLNRRLDLKIVIYMQILLLQS